VRGVAGAGVAGAANGAVVAGVASGVVGSDATGTVVVGTDVVVASVTVVVAGSVVAGTDVTRIGSTRGAESGASSRMPAAIPIVTTADATKATIETAGGNDRAMRAASFDYCGGLLMRSR
jgi:hypothetical protein